MSVELAFSGWCEVRLATNPDPFDEPRGVSGWTFALPGEPDLDRIIRFQPAGALGRFGGPAIGVRVRKVRIGGADQAGHALVGAEVRLMDSPVFEGRNGMVAGDAEEPIWPFHIEIRGANLRIARAMLDPATGQPEQVKSAGTSMKPAEFGPSGVGNPVAYKAARIQAVQQRLANEQSPPLRAGLQRRLTKLQAAEAGLMWGPVPAAFFVDYDYTLRSPAGVVDDPGGVMPAIDRNTPWRARLSFGVWDADVLCAWVTGTLTLPP